MTGSALATAALLLCATACGPGEGVPPPPFLAPGDACQMPLRLSYEGEELRLIYSELTETTASVVEARRTRGAWARSGPVLEHPLWQWASVSARGDDVLVALNAYNGRRPSGVQQRIGSEWVPVELPLAESESIEITSQVLSLGGGRGLFIAGRRVMTSPGGQSERTYVGDEAHAWRPNEDWRNVYSHLVRGPNDAPWRVEQQFASRTVILYELVGEAWSPPVTSAVPAGVEFFRAVFAEAGRVFATAVEKDDPEYLLALYELDGSSWRRHRGTPASDYLGDTLIFDGNRDVIWVAQRRVTGNQPTSARLIRQDAEGVETALEFGRDVVTVPTIALDSDGEPLVAWSETTQAIYYTFGERYSRCALQLRSFSTEALR